MRASTRQGGPAQADRPCPPACCLFRRGTSSSSLTTASRSRRPWSRSSPTRCRCEGGGVRGEGSGGWAGVARDLGVCAQRAGALGRRGFGPSALVHAPLHTCLCLPCLSHDRSTTSPSTRWPRRSRTKGATRSSSSTSSSSSGSAWPGAWRADWPKDESCCLVGRRAAPHAVSAERVLSSAGGPDDARTALRLELSDGLWDRSPRPVI